MAFRITVATSCAELEKLEGTWRELEAARPRFIFQRFEPAMAFAAAYADTWTPVVVMVEDAEDRALIALARRRDGRIGALGQRSFEYIDPIATSEEALAVLADATCEAIAGADLDVSCVRGDSAYLSFWRRVLGAERENAALASVGFSHALVLRPGVTRLVGSNDPTRRLIRSFETRFPVTHRTVEPSERAAALDWILNGPPPKTSRGPRSVRRAVDPRSALYLQRLIETSPAEQISIRSLAVRDEPVAMLLGLEYRSTYCAYVLRLSGELVRYSPGMACLYRAIPWVAERGNTELDMMRGDEAFKARWADVRRPLLRMMRGRPATAALASGQIDRLAQGS